MSELTIGAGGVPRLLWELILLLICIIFVDVPLSVLNFVHRPKKKVAGSRIVVTGAARGMGREVAELLCIRHSAGVFLLDKDEAAVEAAAADLRRSGGDAAAFAADVTDPEQLHRLAKEIGPVDMVICNAGVLVTKDFMDVSEAEIRRTMDINVLGVFWTIRAFLESMVVRNSGHIVTMGSMASWSGVRGSPDYCASKHAVRGLMESLEREARERNLDGIKTTTVYPYFVSTGMIQDCHIQHRVGEILSPREAAEAIVWAILEERRHAWVPPYGSGLVFAKGVLPIRATDRLADWFAVSYN